MRRNLDLVIRLQRAGSFQMSVFAAVMGFLVYSSMYAFRKPFAVGTFEGEAFLGLDLKVWLILAQTLGYMASKFYGIKMISELKAAGMQVESAVASGDAAQQLAEIIESHGCDAVFMSTHGGGLRSAVLGSVSQDMVQRSPVPVTLVRVPEGATAD
mgnify:CR=1 FL=1